MFASELNAAIADMGAAGSFLPTTGGTIHGSLTIYSESAGTGSGYWGLEGVVTNSGPVTGTGFKFGYLSRAAGGGTYDIGFTNFTTFTAAGTRQMGMWFMTVSPNDQTNPFSCQLGEWNIVNRGPDCGWMADPAGRGHVGGGLLNATGGLTIIPMVDAGGAEGGGEGKNVTYGFCISGGPVNSTGIPIGFYNGYIVSSGAIVGGTGRGMYMTGDISGVTSRVPYGPVQFDGNWLHGIDHTSATYTDTHAEVLKAGQGIAWINGTTPTPTATASITGAGSGSDISLVMHPAGNGLIALNGNVARASFIDGIYMGGLTGASNSDVSKGMDFYGGIIGFGITSARLNYVVSAGSAHMFVVNGVDRMAITGTGLGFNGTAPIAKPTGVPVTIAAVHAALVSYGLIAP